MADSRKRSEPKDLGTPESGLSPNAQRQPSVAAEGSHALGMEGAALLPKTHIGAEEESQPSQPSKLKGFWQSMPSWMVSMFVHLAAILGLAAWHLEPIQEELRLMLVSTESSEDGDSLEQVSAEESSASESEQMSSDDVASNVPALETPLNENNPSIEDAMIVSVPEVAAETSASIVPKSASSAQFSSSSRQAMTGRSKDAKRELLSRFGGTSETERAVSQALKWLAEHQDKKSGAWTLSHGDICKNECDHSGERKSSLNAATGLALMCFLGAGQTHIEGEYKEVVFRGLSFLIRNMKFQKGYGSWWVGTGNRGQDDMYAHGIATIAICEAYGMTRDPKLYEAAQTGINFLSYAQNPTTGGWHYQPKGTGDTSVVGWQMMALKSGAMSGLTVDIDVVRKANYFLDQMAWDNGSAYHYSFSSAAKNAKYSPSCTACAALCRMYSGMKKDHPALKAMVEKFDKTGPINNSTYYNYYATQVMKQYGGKEWDRWNTRMRDRLVSTQSQSGHSAGSWYWDDAHGSKQGGRLYITCMSTMILEVYYRYLPIYSEQADEDAFQL